MYQLSFTDGGSWQRWDAWFTTGPGKPTDQQVAVTQAGWPMKTVQFGIAWAAPGTGPWWNMIPIPMMPGFVAVSAGNLIVLAGFMTLISFFRERRRKRRGSCAMCGYLVKYGSRCPECGEHDREDKEVAPGLVP